MKPTKQTNLLIPEDVMLNAKKRAADEKTTVSAVVTALLQGWLAGDIHIPPPKERRGRPKKIG